MSSAKKIGLFACTGVVAGNMMGSGIASVSYTHLTLPTILLV